MKLLSILKNREVKQESDVVKRLRSQEINEEYQRKLTLLNTLNDDFEKALKSQKDIYATEKEAHLLWRQKEEEEVKKLESRRVTALLPIEEREKAAENRERELKEFEIKQKNREIEFDELMESLQTKLAEATEIKTRNDQISRTLGLEKQGIEKQQGLVKFQANQLSEVMSQTLIQSRRKEGELASRETACKLKEEGFEMRESRIEAENEKIKSEWIRIADQRQVLEIEFNRLKQK